MGLVKDIFYFDDQLYGNASSDESLFDESSDNESSEESSKEPERNVFDRMLDLLSAARPEDGASSAGIDRVIDRVKQEKLKAEAKDKERAEQEKKAREAHQEEVDRVTKMDLPLDWENVFNGDARAKDVHAESHADALVLSLAHLGRVDIEYMAQISNSDMRSVILDLKGSIFQNPETWEACWYKGWETKEQYLSGNLLRKREIASKLNEEYDGYFRDNIAEIDAALPQLLTTDQIYVTLGSPWVPTDVIDAFANHIVGLDGWPVIEGTRHDPITGSWELPYRGSSFISGHNAFGTSRITALSLLEKTLNSRSVKITDSLVKGAEGKETRVVNEEETLAALEQQKRIRAEFDSWIWSDPARSKRLQDIYQRNFGCVKQRKFDGSFLRFPEMDPDVFLYPYQKDAVARMIMMPNTLLAHDVGAGKTYMMIAAGMELKRMGISEKNLYVVPNSIVTQWSTMFAKIYPSSRVLSILPKDFTPAKRQEVLATIRDGNFDAIVMPYSCFEAIPLSETSKLAALERDLNEITDILESASNSNTKNLSRKTSKMREQIDELCEAISQQQEEIIWFDNLGITRLFVDEAHNFKNVPIETKMQGCLGINSRGSRRCQDMMNKVRFVQRQNGGGGVVFATGTPISNSITDAFIMQKYLQNGELAMVDLQSFDDWVRMFAEPSTEFEIDVDTSSFRMVTRLSKFHNLPELTTLMSSIADFYLVDDLAGVPSEVDREDIVVEKSEEFERYLQSISKRTDAIRCNAVQRTQDNMLKVTTDGRMAALDIRLVEPSVSADGKLKVLACAESVADIYFATEEDRSTQLIFCDVSTPKKEFNVYCELRSLLVQLGVREEEIAFIHDFDAPAARSVLFKQMRKGEKRVLIGSTFKVGIGVNIQDKLVALHHLDVPWRPADMKQREGRMLRPGNVNDKVKIFRYITEGSFDAYSWQLLETKQSFIGELLAGSLENRTMGEIDDSVLDYAEVKAIAIGDERIKQRVEAVNELSRLSMLQRKQKTMIGSYQAELQSVPDRRARLKRSIERCAMDRDGYQVWKDSHPEEFRDNATKKQKEARAAYRDLLYQSVKDQALAQHEKQLPSYRGFNIAVPANISPNDAFVYVGGENRYRVKLGTSPQGYLVRIDNFLERLGNHHDKLVEKLEALNMKEKELKMKIAQEEDHTDQIESLKAKIRSLDEALGIEG
ncbi:SNF2-related protein [Anaerotardibacter muris]|uniref:SNF2-related protein n=1 Tax=Anaerotardibacter muris TaxID=2941505 RepID=UPI00203B3789|nr:SNF2-related protein [Anaerotardibacter muris]